MVAIGVERAVFGREVFDAEVERGVVVGELAVGRIKNGAEGDNGNDGGDDDDDELDDGGCKDRFARAFAFAFDGDLVEIGFVVHEGIIA